MTADLFEADLDKQLAAAIQHRIAGRKLFREYMHVFDPEKPKVPGAYPWQVEFHNAGATHPERLLMAGNRVGKTQCAAAETAIHLTGEYPPWWRGKRFTKPVTWWSGAERTEDSKDVVQVALLGPEGDHGTGWIPRDRIIDVTYRQAGVSNVADQIFVRHTSGGISRITLKTYQMEAKGWRGARLNGVWLDEECKQDIYTEAQTRTLDLKGIVLMTFTPLLGPTEVVRHFLEAGEDSGIYVKNVTWDDAPHLGEKEKQRQLESYPEWERDARSRGVPLLGSGSVFPLADDDIACEPFRIPDHFYRINGIDFGIDHPAAGAYCAWDKDGDTFYVYDGYKRAGETPVYHAAAMTKYGDWIPTAWPHDGAGKDSGSGHVLKDQYKKHGLFMLRDHAHYPDERGNHREPGLIEMLEWMKTGRFKVFKTCRTWFEEKRMYHRKDGVVVMRYDDLISATRYAFMMRRFARHKPSVSQKRLGPSKPIVGGRRWTTLS